MGARVHEMGHHNGRYSGRLVFHSGRYSGRSVDAYFSAVSVYSGVLATALKRCLWPAVRVTYFLQ